MWSVRVTRSAHSLALARDSPGRNPVAHLAEEAYSNWPIGREFSRHTGVRMCVRVCVPRK